MKGLLLALALLSITGCETTKLWAGHDQEQYLKVVPSSPEEDVEAALKGSDREYQCTELYDSTYPNNKVCYIKVSPTEKIQSRLLKTPETLVTDAGNTIKVVGYVLLSITMQSGYHN